MAFESSVNSEGIETYSEISSDDLKFESSVNSEGIETFLYLIYLLYMFESSVNSEGIETRIIDAMTTSCLRAV